MPVLRITLIEGYDDTRRRLSARLTDAVRATIAAPLDGITVAIDEVKPANYMRGRAARTPGVPLAAPIEIVRDYLTRMEARDLKGASAHLAADFRMTFPGGATFSRPQDLVEWAAARYRFVTKSYEGFDEAFSDAGTAVYCFGTLSGEWPDGTPFSDIRFIDRFTVKDGKLSDQRVWNDLAETAGGK